ncbi:fibrillin 1 [Salpingoeca rosetta]|uniref:Fibrillin 1 n=1 Tax=Salpingoeca rosetta (strain ATCC 50818 / BSB-021) TaxID=946362 RepID=F2UBQ5_SALR5|nr:fibrillin 1 [Salpingoeca rosetta]EGD73921.1 fibrillin 1 [Salpingoeca rosetta]|eukprot:XP_004993484.1 fibrillin 1 [Salpingoeca rosetta]
MNKQSKHGRRSRRNNVGVCVAWFVMVAVLALDGYDSVLNGVAALTTQEKLNQLCYQVSWDLAAPRPKRQAIRPVSKFPHGHAYVNEEYCGEQKSPGDVIPAYGNWLYGSTCQNVTGGSVFYAYNYPNGASSNTGFEQSESDLLYFVVDEDLRVSFVLVHDKPDDPTGGRVRLEINSPDLAGEGVQVLERDDNTGFSPSCFDATNDCYHWDTDTGYGNFYWAWAACCTDGMVLGHINDLEWRFNIRYFKEDLVDIDKFKIGNFREDANTMDFITLDADAVSTSGVEVRALSCEAYCAAKTSCGECIADPQCGWCESSGCTTTTLAETCAASEWQESGCCAVCTLQNDCTSCVNTPGCGWSYDRAECLSGAYTQGSCEPTTWYQLHEANVTQCLHPPGAVFNDTSDSVDTDVVFDWCSGHGTYSFDDNTCTCDAGYFGADCARECPGGASNPCNGNGECDALTGQCYCDCGFAGANCSITGCPCTDEFCFLSEDGACPLLCGRNLASKCTGSDVLELPVADRPSARIASDAGRCACTSKFWGPSCNMTCPGVNDDGSGDVCGGLGSCSVADGTCSCEPCYAPNPTTGICEDAPCPTCLFDGECVCVNGEKTCSCKGQRDGDTCELCNCLNGGSCNAITGECDCAAGFYGDLCDFACTRETLCNGHGTCNGPLRRCDCDADYVGDEDHQCEFYCPAEACLNNGTCSLSNGTCLCQMGYFGASCQNNTCQLDPCQNGGACRMDFFNKEFGYTCECQPGFEGQNCEVDIDECLLGNDCYGADCIDKINGYTCKCKPGYIRVTPTACVEIDECRVGVHFCDEHATCMNVPGGYECVCNDGYAGTGFACSNVDECALGTHTCDDHATCADTEGSFTCTCGDGYLGDGLTTGVGCQEYCWDNPCMYGGECTFTRDNYTCTCASGYEGTNCELNATVCAALSPCAPGATCINGRVVAPGEFPQFTCNCSAELGHPSCTVLRPAASTQTLLEGKTAPFVFAAIGGGALLLLIVVAVALRRRSSSNSTDTKTASDMADDSTAAATTTAATVAPGVGDALMASEADGKAEVLHNTDNAAVDDGDASAAAYADTSQLRESVLVEDESDDGEDDYARAHDVRAGAASEDDYDNTRGGNMKSDVGDDDDDDDDTYASAHAVGAVESEYEDDENEATEPAAMASKPVANTNGDSQTTASSSSPYYAVNSNGSVGEHSVPVYEALRRNESSSVLLASTLAEFADKQ